MNTSVIQGFVALLLARLEELPLSAPAAAVFAVIFTLLTPYLLRRFADRWPADPKSRRSLLTDLTYTMLSPVAEVFARTVTTLAVAVCALCFGRTLEPALLHGFGPVTHQPYWLIVIEVLILSDFIFYWTHRMAHRVPMLWKLHAIHHSTEHMRAPAALRVHPLESYALVFNTVPLFALGFPLDALLVLAPISFMYALLIHSNLPFSARRFSYLVNSPSYHRWHHSRDFKGDGSNFAGYFPIFDVLFGSYHYPKEPPQSLGIDDADMPESYAAQLLYPLRRNHSGLSAETEVISLRGDNHAEFAVGQERQSS